MSREFVFVLSGDASGIEAAAQRGATAINGATQSTVALDAAQKRAEASTQGLVSRLMGAAAGAVSLYAVKAAAFSAADALTQAQIRAERLNMQFTAAVGAGQAGRELDYVRAVSNRLGLELNTTAQSYARFAAAARGTSLEGNGARQIFDAVAKSAAVMGLNVEETQGVLRALEQMMSKGTVQAEELRGQLGDRMPGALQIAARAMGVTTGELSKMVERGEVLANDFLPRFARQLEVELGGGAEKAAETMQAAMNRVGNAFELLKQGVAAISAESQKGQLNVLADGLLNVSEKLELARRAGGGMREQVAAGTLAVLQFLNPLNAFAYSAQSLEGRLKEATERLQGLQAAANSRPNEVYITWLRNETLSLIASLMRARELLSGTDNQSAAETNRLAAAAAAAKKPEEERARRMEALKRVTEELSGANTKLAQTLRTLAQSYTAGDLEYADYERMVHDAQRQLGPKGEKRKPPPISDQTILDVNDARLRQAERFAEADRPARDFMDAAVQRSDERVLRAQQRRTEQAAQFTQQVMQSAATVDANLIRNAEVRGQALIAIERAQLTSRLDVMKLEGEERARAEDAIAQYILSREAQLTEELKPEWQRQVEAWTDVMQAMKRTRDEFLGGWLNNGRDAFVQFAMTGKLNIRSLVDYARAEFAKMYFNRFLASGMSSLGNSLLNGLMGAIGGGGSGFFTSAIGSSGFGGMGYIGGGAATGTNYVERDMLTILHKGEAVVPKAFNPSAGAAAGAAPSVVINQTINAAPGTDPTMISAAMEAARRAAVAEVMDAMRRGRLVVA